MSVLHSKHGVTPYGTGDSSTREIDHLLCSPNLLEYITATGITALGAFFGSDHRGVWADLELRRFLQSTVGVRHNPWKCDMKASDTIQSAEFLDELEKHLNANHVQNTIDKLYGKLDRRRRSINIAFSN